MLMWTWFRHRFAPAASQAPYFPAMFRIRDADGRFVDEVEITGTCEPSGNSVHATKRTAAGLCLLHWPGKARRLRLTLRSGDGSALVDVESHRAEPDRVIEIRLKR